MDGAWHMSTQRKLGRISARLAMAIEVVMLGVPAFAQSAPQMRPLPDLDRPGESYCIDVLGAGVTARADLSLLAHNCLPGRGGEDRIATLRDSRILMPAFGACVTAFGVRAPLPRPPLMPRPRGAQESFVPAGDLQRFDRDGRDRLGLAGTDLCLTVGPDVERTFSGRDR